MPKTKDDGSAGKFSMFPKANNFDFLVEHFRMKKFVSPLIYPRFSNSRPNQAVSKTNFLLSQTTKYLKPIACKLSGFFKTSIRTFQIQKTTKCKSSI